MKIKDAPGEFAFRAVIKTGNGWKLTPEFYFTKEEAARFNAGLEMLWPIEQIDELVYVPSKEETEEDN